MLTIDVLLTVLVFILATPFVLAHLPSLQAVLKPVSVRSRRVRRR